MTDQTMNVSKATAIGLWVTALVVLTAGTTLAILLPTEAEIHGSIIVCMWSIPLFAAAGVATVRDYFVKQDVAISNAYNIGRDSQRVTSMR